MDKLMMMEFSLKELTLDENDVVKKTVRKCVVSGLLTDSKREVIKEAMDEALRGE